MRPRLTVPFRWLRAVTFRAVSYVVLGCGAIGAALAAGLVRDGHEVLVCDADPAVVQAVRVHGLRVEGAGQAVSVHVPAVEPDGLPARLDGPGLVTVRAQHTAAAATVLAGRLRGGRGRPRLPAG